jgi:hypothetical protein
VKPATPASPRLGGGRVAISPHRWWCAPLVCLLLLSCPSCTEVDEQLVENVGVTQLLLVDTGLRSQSVIFFSPVDLRIQVAEWDIDVGGATLDVEGSLVDLLFGEPCFFTDTHLSSPQTTDPCGSGVVIESSPSPFDVTLLLTVTEMRMRRERPLEDAVDQSDNADWDGDGVPNSGDNCPLVPNTDQADENFDGVGDECTVFDPFFGSLPDSDADGVPDTSDNCVWKENPDQADDGISALGDDPQPNNGIGDACEEQLAPVEPFVLGVPPDQLQAMLLQRLGGTTFLTVDFDDRDAMICNWATRSCTLDPSEVEFCTHDNFFDALNGC